MEAAAGTVAAEMQKTRPDAPIVSTKLIPPAISGRLTARPRLLARAQDILAARLTFVRAAAGFGKSTLMVQWRDQLRADGAAVAWVSMDARDVDPAKVIAQILFSIADATSAISSATLSLAHDYSFCEAEILLSRMIGDITLHDAPVCLMLDDIHTVGNDAVRSIVTQLVDRAPANLKIIATSREGSWIPLGRMRAFGHLFELSVDDLRFEAEEFADLLTNEGVSGAARDTLEAIGGKVEGWVAGLKFAVATARAAPDHMDRLVGLSGSDYAIADFFKEEVLEKQSPDYFDFLLQTSILTRMCASLCDAVTGRTDGQEVLDRIVREGLFIFSLDPDRVWYRYHHLFGDFLLAEVSRRDPRRLKDLHGRASHWYEEQHLHADAFHHLLEGGDLEAAGALFARVCEDMFRRGEITAVFEWAGQLPAEIIAKHPIIHLTVIWWLTVEWRFFEAEQLLDRVEGQLGSVALAPKEDRHVRFRILHHRANIAIFQERMAGARKISEALTADFSDASAYVRATFPLMSLQGDIAGLRFDNIACLAEQSLRDFQEANAPFSLIWHHTLVGTAKFLAGQPEEAIDLLRVGIDTAERFRGITGISSMPAICLARILYERNEIAEATALMRTHFEAISYCGIVHQLVFGYVVKARLAQAEGDEKEAERVIEKGLNFAKARGFERFRLHMIAEKVRLLTLSRREDELERLLRAERLDRDEARILPDPAGETVNVTEIQAMIWVRAARQAGHLSEAIAVCRRWRDFTLRRGAVISEIHWRLMLVELLCLNGEERQAGRELIQAVLVASPRQLLRAFLDAGEPVVGRLKELAPALQSNPIVQEFLERFLKAAPVEAPPSPSPEADRYEVPMLGALSHRELAILQYVSKGYLNREVGDFLCLTEGSVKWHLHQVFQKLGVKKRRQAIDRARSLGLI
jgi:ATP/maltotriose-dependent transcriptional regulator MalT